jgi:hypothetical protein
VYGCVCMCVCVCVCVCVCIQTNVYTNRHTHTHTQYQRLNGAGLGDRKLVVLVGGQVPQGSSGRCLHHRISRLHQFVRSAPSYTDTYTYRDRHRHTHTRVCTYVYTYICASCPYSSVFLQKHTHMYLHIHTHILLHNIYIGIDLYITHVCI